MRSALARRTLALALLILFVGCASSGLTGGVAFTTIRRAWYSDPGSIQPTTAVIRSAAEWAALKQPPGELPPVDFKTSMLIAVYSGPLAGNPAQAEISRIERQGNALVVSYHWGPIPQDIRTADVIANTYHLVQLERHDGPVEFKYQSPPAPVDR